MNIITLKPYFVGGGSKKGMIFNQIHNSTQAYVYEINNNDSIHYEVFKVRKTPICIDFEKRIYSDEDFKIMYPKDKDFGVWAWCYKNKDKAMKKYIDLNLVFNVD